MIKNPNWQEATSWLSDSLFFFFFFFSRVSLYLLNCLACLKLQKFWQLSKLITDFVTWKEVVVSHRFPLIGSLRNEDDDGYEDFI